VNASEKRKEGIFVLHDTRTRSKLLHHHQGAEQYGFHLVHPFSPQNGTGMPFAIAAQQMRRNPAFRLVDVAALPGITPRATIRRTSIKHLACDSWSPSVSQRELRHRRFSS
jgi:hypothetical protein